MQIITREIFAQNRAS